MKLRVFVVLALTFAFSGSCFADETVSAKGRVVDKDGKPAEGFSDYD